MNVSCPECQTVFRVDPARVPGPGVRARCSVCGGIIPITTVDGQAIASGQPGPVTRRLDDLYWSKRRAGWLTTPVDYDAPLRFDPR